MPTVLPVAHLTLAEQLFEDGAPQPGDFEVVELLAELRPVRHPRREIPTGQHRRRRRRVAAVGRGEPRLQLREQRVAGQVAAGLRLPVREIECVDDRFELRDRIARNLGQLRRHAAVDRLQVALEVVRANVGGLPAAQLPRRHAVGRRGAGPRQQVRPARQRVGRRGRCGRVRRGDEVPRDPVFERRGRRRRAELPLDVHGRLVCPERQQPPRGTVGVAHQPALARPQFALSEGQSQRDGVESQRHGGARQRGVGGEAGAHTDDVRRVTARCRREQPVDRAAGEDGRFRERAAVAVALEPDAQLRRPARPAVLRLAESPHRAQGDRIRAEVVNAQRQQREAAEARPLVLAVVQLPPLVPQFVLPLFERQRADLPQTHAAQFQVEVVAFGVRSEDARLGDPLGGAAAVVQLPDSPGGVRLLPQVAARVRHQHRPPGLEGAHQQRLAAADDRVPGPGLDRGRVVCDHAYRGRREAVPLRLEAEVNQVAVPVLGRRPRQRDGNGFHLERQRRRQPAKLGRELRDLRDLGRAARHPAGRRRGRLTERERHRPLDAGHVGFVRVVAAAALLVFRYPRVRLVQRRVGVPQPAGRQLGRPLRERHLHAGQRRQEVVPAGGQGVDPPRRRVARPRGRRQSGERTRPVGRGQREAHRQRRRARPAQRDEAAAVVEGGVGAGASSAGNADARGSPTGRTHARVSVPKASDHAAPNSTSSVAFSPPPSGGRAARAETNTKCPKCVSGS